METDQLILSKNINRSAAQLTDSLFLQRKYANAFTMFMCDDNITTVHPSLVCDFSQDCPDKSDESFCDHLLCPEFMCSNGQCVSRGQRCNQYSDCLDDSDEVDCSDDHSYLSKIKKEDIKKLFYINLDGAGYFTQQLMTADHSCPESHYRCRSEWLYCLPVYTRCNGFSDCVYGEDEKHCEAAICSSLYRCRDSTVCLHSDHLCDGWGQCPQRDDELMCDKMCPEGCLCQGHVFLCNIPFAVDRFSQLGYADTTGSRMALKEFHLNTNLVHLVLSHCRLYNISQVKLPNLQHVDLSSNCIISLAAGVLLALPNLRRLQLQNNPLAALTSEGKSKVHYALEHLDISQTQLNIFDKELMIYFPHIEFCNISFSGLQIVRPIGFKAMAELKEVDVRGNDLTSFPVDLFSRSNNVIRIFSSNYRLCCSHVVPALSTEVNCVSPHSVLQSCASLLPSELHTAFFGAVAVSAIVGNVFCLVCSSALRELLGSKFVMTVAQLQLADIMMGCHVSIAVAAHLLFHGRYLRAERAWTSSGPCQLAGFLCLVSSTVSVLVLFFLTVHHCAALCFPHNSCTRHPRWTTATCAVTWTVGVVLSQILFLPGQSHWGVHAQSGLCRMALFNNYDSSHNLRWFSVLVMVNAAFCLVILIVEMLICWKIPQYRLQLNHSQRPVYSSVHMMTKITATGVLCWIVLGMVTVMNSHNGTVFSDIHDTMVVFVVPFNSALNPVLFLWAIYTQSRVKQQEEKLLRVLKTRLSSCQGKNSQVNKYAK